MSRSVEVYLQDVAGACAKVQSYIEGRDFAAFSSDERTIDAVVRNLEIIGEAVKGIPRSFRDAHPDIPWKRLAGLRDILIHEYFGVDLDIIWDIVRNVIPPIEARIRSIQPDTGSDAYP